MARHVWSVYATLASIDNTSNNVSIIEAIEQLVLPHPPVDVERFVFPLRSVIVTLWARDRPDVEERAIGRVRFIDPQGDELGEWTHEVDLRRHMRSRNRSQFHSIRLSRPGIYEWEIAHAPIDDADNWTIDALVPLNVVMEEDFQAEDAAE